MNHSRRQVLHAGGAVGVLSVLGAAMRHADAAETFEVTHTEEEWHKLLTPNQFKVLRESATERPFTSPLNDEHRKGIFSCAGCELELFASERSEERRVGKAC